MLAGQEVGRMNSGGAPSLPRLPPRHTHTLCLGGSQGKMFLKGLLREPGWPRGGAVLGSGERHHLVLPTWEANAALCRKARPQTQVPPAALQPDYPLSVSVDLLLHLRRVVL